MAPLSRRRFLKRTSAAAAGLAIGLTILESPQTASGQPANETVVMAVDGQGGTQV